MQHQVVIGAGWAGLSCAYTLARAGHKVTLIDAAPQTGGRARTVPFKQHLLDNGQHICIGAHQATLKLMQDLKLNPQDFFSILPMEIHAFGEQNLKLLLADLPSPWNLIWGILSSPSLEIKEKFQILTFCYRIRARKFLLKSDCSVLEMLENYQQSSNIIQRLWEPIALAAMTTPINQASAQVFLNILQRTFTGYKNNSNWYLPRTDLSNLLPIHIERYLLEHGCQIIYANAIKELNIVKNECVAAKSLKHTWQADNYILALPPWQAKSLVDMPALNAFTYQPITTIYFEFADKVCAPYPMLGLINQTCQWIFDRNFAMQPNIISAVISGSGAHQDLDPDLLAEQILREITAILPNLPRLIDKRVIREKRAAFHCDVAIQSQRPTARTPITNVWLAGDYLQTGLPSTLEGAVLSGIQTGELILEKYIASL